MRKRSALLLVLGVLALAVLGGYLAWRLTQSAMTSAVSRMTERKEETIDLSALVTQVREMSRLETASMRVVHVATTTQSYEMVPNALAGDELTFLAAGDVIAGVDLALLQQNDVWREPDGTVVMRLPPAQILVSRVDNRESKVINRKTGLLRKSDVHLEARARQTAEQGIRNEAMKKGILTLASQNAETKLAQFLLAVGVQRVRFERRALARQIE
jgi:hypothetical protein